MFGLKKRRLVLVILMSVATIFVATLFTLWRSAIKRNRQIPVGPVHIAGNLYYVGTTDVSSFLLTGPEGHVLIDGAYPETAPMIIESISKLGYDITDVKVLLNSHAHPDHAGGLATLQEASGAELWVSEEDADVIEAGGRVMLLSGLYGRFNSWGLAPSRPHMLTTASKMERQSASDQLNLLPMSRRVTHLAVHPGRSPSKMEIVSS